MSTVRVTKFDSSGNIKLLSVVELTDREGRLLDMKRVTFKTEAGCIYCPAGQCTCDVSICIHFFNIYFGGF